MPSLYLGMQPVKYTLCKLSNAYQKHSICSLHLFHCHPDIILCDTRELINSTMYQKALETLNSCINHGLDFCLKKHRKTKKKTYLLEKNILYSNTENMYMCYKYNISLGFLSSSVDNCTSSLIRVRQILGLDAQDNLKNVISQKSLLGCHI